MSNRISVGNITVLTNKNMARVNMILSMAGAVPIRGGDADSAVSVYSTGNKDEFWVFDKNLTELNSIFVGLEIESVNFDNFDASDITAIHKLFYNTHVNKLVDLSNFDTSNVISMSKMFNASIFHGGIKFGGKFNTSKVTLMESMFEGSSISGDLDLSTFDTSNVISMAAMFKKVYTTGRLIVDNFNTSKVQYMQAMFDTINIDTVKDIDLSSFDMSNVFSTAKMFHNAKIGNTIKGIGKLNPKKLRYANGMFSCTYLQSLDLRNWDLSRVKNMSYFCEKSNIKELTLPKIAADVNINGCFDNANIETLTVDDEFFENTMAYNKALATFDDVTLKHTFLDNSSITSVKKIQSQSAKYKSELKNSTKGFKFDLDLDNNNKIEIFDEISPDISKSTKEVVEKEPPVFTLLKPPCVNE